VIGQFLTLTASSPTAHCGPRIQTRAWYIRTRAHRVSSRFKRGRGGRKKKSVVCEVGCPEGATLDGSLLSRQPRADRSVPAADPTCEIVRKYARGLLPSTRSIRRHDTDRTVSVNARITRARRVTTRLNDGDR